MPTDLEYETSLRNAVQAHYSNPVEEATVRSMRTKSEDDLGLETGFYKNNDVWKEKSKEIIQDQFNKCEAEQAEGKEAAEKRKSLKRASPSTTSRPRKKSKLEEEDESTALSEPPESASEEDSAEEEVAPKKKGGRKQTTKTTKTARVPKSAPKKAKKDSSTSELSDAPSHDLSDPEEDERTSNKDRDQAEDSSSELSSVIDEPQPTRKSFKSKNGSTSKPSKSTSKSKTKASAESDPKAEEIKRLQGWLVKCGIRKVWGKELKPYETQNAKISHLKSMLADVGMTGRFSNEKAAQIKEARELAADIEAVQEGNERWGKDGEDEAEGPERGGRRLVRGAKNYAFLSSDGEEESE